MSVRALSLPHLVMQTEFFPLKVNAAFAWGPILELVEHILYRNAPPLTTMPKAKPPGHTFSSRFSILDAVPTGILMTVLWWALTDGRMDSWVVGIPVIALASGISLYLQAHDLWRWSLPGLIRFFPRFLWMSFRGGLEVAVPAFHPQCPLAPKLVTYRLRLPEGPARIFFANATSLSPGTFSADLHEDQLTIHILDARRPINKDLEILESLVAGLFGIQLSPEPPSQQEHDE